MADLLKDFTKAIKETVIESVDIETADHLIETLDTIFSTMIEK